MGQPLTLLLDAVNSSLASLCKVDFSEYLCDALSRAGISQNAAGDLLGVSGPFINQIIKKNRTPPIDQLERWGVILSKSVSIDVKLFIWLGQLAHAPEEVRGKVRLAELLLGESLAHVTSCHKQSMDEVAPLLALDTLSRSTNDGETQQQVDFSDSGDHAPARPGRG
jgi:transcriptional regulator with XRE-family HTH domain